MNIFIYTDASFSEELNVAACGYLILKTKNGPIIKHEVAIVENIDKVPEAECYAIYLGMVEAFMNPHVRSVQIVTDCHIANAVANYQTQKYEGRMYFEDLREVLDVYYEHHIPVGCKKIKGHADNPWNNKIDQSVRKYLRRYLKEVVDLVSKK